MLVPRLGQTPVRLGLLPSDNSGPNWLQLRGRIAAGSRRHCPTASMEQILEEKQHEIRVALQNDPHIEPYTRMSDSRNQRGAGHTYTAAFVVHTRICSLLDRSLPLIDGADRGRHFIVQAEALTLQC